MTTYKLNEQGAVIRDDGAHIPADPLNTDYAAYLAWVAASNAPTTPASPSLADVQQNQTARLSAACQAAILAGFTSNALGALHTYPAQMTDQTNLASSVLSALLAVQEASTWAANTPYVVGSLVAANGQVFVNMTAGTSSPNVPGWPTVVDTTALDGGAQWEIWSTPFWCEDSAGSWARVDHTISQIMQVGRDGKAAILALLAKKDALSAQVSAAGSAVAVQAITWS